MASLAWGSELPFGGRAAGLYSLNTEPATYGTLVDVPRFQGFEAREEEDATEMNAGDVRVAIHTTATRLTGSLTYGGLNFDSLAVVTGGTVGAVVGTTPNRTCTFARRTTDQKKYFKFVAQMYADDTGDDHFIGYKMKASGGPTYSANQGEFMVTNMDLEGVYTSESPGKLYDIIAHETVAAIA